MGLTDAPPLPAWTPFKRIPLTAPTPQQMRLTRARYGLSKRQASRLLRRRLAELLQEDGADAAEQRFRNSRYIVRRIPIAATDECGPMVLLSITRVDALAAGPERYRDFMRIRDEILGPDCEAVELYPARRREVDYANQYHLWAVAAAGARFPFGFDGGRRVRRAGPGQRPFAPDDYTDGDGATCAPVAHPGSMASQIIARS